jgi:hypothetical protein
MEKGETQVNITEFPLFWIASLVFDGWKKLLDYLVLPLRYVENMFDNCINKWEIETDVRDIKKI